MEQVAKAIGYIVYAVASADNHIDIEEKKAIHDVVNVHWETLSDKEDPFGARALDFIDKMMLVLEEEHVSSEFAFELFKDTFDQNREKFTPELIEFVIEICIKTGSAFNRMNKSELVLLSRIENLLRSK